MKILITLLFTLFTVFASAGDITISKGVASAHQKKLEYDFDFLKKLEFSKDINPRTLEVLGIDELTNETAHSWLRDRVSYIVENQNFLFIDQLLARKQVLVLQRDVEYPVYENEEMFSIPSVPFLATPDEKTKALVVMTNIGTGIYKLGKRTKQLLGFQMNGGSLEDEMNIPVESPRTGIIQIGEGLFSAENIINKKNTYAISNSIKRLGTIFHEARHSDGNGKSMGFYHSVCPKGHELAGLSACDNNLNGPYTVGALMMKELAKACDGQCTKSEKEMLKIAILDSLNRVQRTTKSGSRTVDLDATPESI